ncbi:MAG: hypothetical protein ACRYHQ_26640 [Janthinobacterium lividum]
MRAATIATTKVVVAERVVRTHVDAMPSSFFLAVLILATSSVLLAMAFLM